MREVVADVKQWLAGDRGKGVGVAVGEVQAGGMAAATAKLAVGARRTCGLLGIERHRCDAQLTDEALDAPQIFGRQSPRQDRLDFNQRGRGNLGR